MNFSISIILDQKTKVVHIIGLYLLVNYLKNLLTFEQTIHQWFLKILLAHIYPKCCASIFSF
jgi:hypothetical protein